VVSGIVGQTRLTIEFTGQANHPAHTAHACVTMPGRCRRMGHWRLRGSLWQPRALVATVGKVDVDPMVGNVVPGKAQSAWTCGTRTMRRGTYAVEGLMEKANSLPERRGLALQRYRPIGPAG